jgi:hypothetical protein
VLRGTGDSWKVMGFSHTFCPLAIVLIASKPAYQKFSSCKTVLDIVEIFPAYNMPIVTMLSLYSMCIVEDIHTSSNLLSWCESTLELHYYTEKLSEMRTRDHCALRRADALTT